MVMTDDDGNYTEGENKHIKLGERNFFCCCYELLMLNKGWIPIFFFSFYYIFHMFKARTDVLIQEKGKN